MNLENKLENPSCKDFDKIANTLINQYLIKKFASILDKNIFYKIIELEFYLYKENHKDIITYPRNTNAFEWFFHYSGVDITFKTQLSDGQLSQFGGVLIRSVEKYVDGELDSIYTGPLITMKEIFSCTNRLPILEICETKTSNRKILKTERQGISLVEEYSKALYRYYVDIKTWSSEQICYRVKNKKVVEEKIKRHYSSKPKGGIEILI